MFKPYIKATHKLIFLFLAFGLSASVNAQGLDLPYSGAVSQHYGSAFEIENEYQEIVRPPDSPWTGPDLETLSAILGRYSYIGPSIIDPTTGEQIISDYQNIGRLGGHTFGVEGICDTENGYGVRAVNNAEGGTGLYAIGTSGFAGLFEGDVVLRAIFNDPGDIIFQTSNGIQKARIWSEPSGPSGLHMSSGDNTPDITVNSNGNVGIGTQSPAVALDVQGSWTEQLVVRNSASPNQFLYEGVHSSGYARIGTWNNNTSAAFNLVLQDAGGNVGVGTETPEHKLDVAGTTATNVLVIRGGMDLAEPFDVSNSQSIQKGAVLVIDEENPGQLKLSTCPYDPRVAGVVSGAGGINPGLTLTQREICKDGINVALTGRVYALADTSNGPIIPGDLLTTSGTPGHAMKATDTNRSFGAIIGKAMTPLENGRGLVLVLVSLQ